MESSEIREQEPEGVFHPSKAIGGFTPLAEWLARRSTNERLCMVLMLELFDADLQIGIPQQPVENHLLNVYFSIEPCG